MDEVQRLGIIVPSKLYALEETMKLLRCKRTKVWQLERRGILKRWPLAGRRCLYTGQAILDCINYQPPPSKGDRKRR